MYTKRNVQKTKWGQDKEAGESMVAMTICTVAMVTGMFRKGNQCTIEPPADIMTLTLSSFNAQLPASEPALFP